MRSIAVEAECDSRDESPYESIVEAGRIPRKEGVSGCSRVNRHVVAVFDCDTWPVVKPTIGRARNNPGREEPAGPEADLGPESGGAQTTAAAS